MSPSVSFATPLQRAAHGLHPKSFRPNRTFSIVEEEGLPHPEHGVPKTGVNTLLTQPRLNQVNPVHILQGIHRAHLAENSTGHWPAHHNLVLQRCLAHSAQPEAVGPGRVSRHAAFAPLKPQELELRQLDQIRHMAIMGNPH